MPEGIALGFDFGKRRIGVAVGEASLGVGRPLTTIDDIDTTLRFHRISELIQEWQPHVLVVGLALALDGTEHQLTRHCRRFANRLRGRFGLPVVLVDERLSSVSAEEALKEAGHDWVARKTLTDARAAQIILQDYFDAASQRRSAF
jgi:putative Holliday junction resolvase